MVTIICYNSLERWKSRKTALNFYKNAVLACEGSERDRYYNIVCDLIDGKKVCTDGEISVGVGARVLMFPNGTCIRDLNGKVEYPIN